MGNLKNLLPEKSTWSTWQVVTHRFIVRDIFVNKDFPYLAASPDGVTECECYGKGPLEIKCPFSQQNEMPRTAVSKTHPVS